MKRILLCLLLAALSSSLLGGCVVSMATPLPVLEQRPNAPEAFPV